MFRLLIPYIFLLFCPQSHALSPLEASHDRADNLHEHVEYIRSEDPKLLPEEVLTRSDWQPISGDTINFGFDTGHYWLRMQLRNQSLMNQSLALEVAYPLLDQLDVYQFDGNLTRVNQFNTGDNRPYQQRPILYPNFIFPLRLAAGQDYQLLIHVQTESAVQLPLTLWHWPELASHAQHQYLGQGLFFGIIFIMALYNLFVWFGERDPVYIFYVCYISMFAVFQLAMQGIGFQVFWPDTPAVNQFIIPFSICVFAAFISRFAIAFFDLKKTHPPSYYATSIFGAFYAIMALACFVLPYHVSIRITAGSGFFACIMMIFIATTMLRRGHPAARYFSLAWGIFLVGGLLIVLNKFSLLPRNFFTENAIQLGAALEVMFLSLALAERMVNAKKQTLIAQNRALKMTVQVSEEKEKTYQAQQHALHIEKEANRNLESTVKQRTEELEQALNSLSILNEQLRDLSLTDALTNLLNRRAFDEYFASEYSRSLRDKTSLTLIMLDIDHFKRFNDTYGHQAGDACLRALADLLLESASRRHDACCRFGGEEFAIIMPNTRADAALHMAEQLRRAVETQRVPWQGGELHFTISLGLHSAVVTDDCPTNREAFIARADAALYDAKGSGRNCCVVA